MPRKKKQTEPAGPQICGVENCSNPVFPGMDFCPIHGLVDMAVSGAQKAFKKGNVWQAMFNSAAAIAIESGGPLVKPAMQGAAVNFARRQAAPPPPPRAKPHILSPWAVLGLDQAKATEKDVKDAQRHLAAFYHPDKGRAVNPEMLKQVNAAAEACLKELKKRGK